MKSTILLTVLFVGTLGVPVSKLTKTFPKKYDETIHSIDGKFKSKDLSSYVSYDQSGQSYPLGLPPALETYTSNDSTDWSHTLFRDDAMDSMVAPAWDTYSKHNGEATDDLLPPKEKETTSVYLGYAEVEGEKSDPLTAPQLSSYYEDKTSEDSTSDKDFASNLRPPTKDQSQDTSSSYLSYESPST